MKSNFSFQKAQWIWIDERISNQYADFICDFNYDEGEATLAISSKTDYALWINGVFVYAGQYGDFPELKSVDVIPVTSFLQKGKNRIAVIGWSLNETTFSRIASGHGVIFEVVANGNVVAHSDESTYARQSREYKSGETHILTPILGPIYEYAFADEWKTPNGKTDGFSPSVIVKDSAKFFKRPIKRLCFKKANDAKIVTHGSYIEASANDLSERLQKAYLSQSTERGNVFTAEENADGVYFVVDLQKETAGFLHFDLETEETCNVFVTFGEHLTDLRVRHKIARRNFMFPHRNAQGRVAFTSYLRRIGCRYLQFFVSAKKVTVHSATLIPTEYPQKQRPLPCNDFLLDQIQKTALNTLTQCMHEHYEDCPWREQAQYGMDSFIQILSGFYAFDNKEFVKAALRLFGHELNKEGFLHLTSPSRIDGLFIPVFSLAFIFSVCEYTAFYKDFSVFKEVRKNVSTILESFLRHVDETGVVKQFDAWNFYEWTDDLHHYDNKDSYHAPLNFFLAKALRDSAPLFRRAGDDTLAKRYEKQADDLCKTAERLFWNEEKGLYATYLANGKQEHFAEYTQSIAVYTAVCPRRKALRLCKILSQENDLIPVSISSYLFKYSALLNTSEQYRQFVAEDIKRVWGKMLFQGATSFWETQKGESDFGDAGSLCHGWSALPIYILNHYRLL